MMNIGQPTFRQMCHRYDKAEEDAESEVEEDEVDEFEFSDDETETAWRRKQRAAEPSKRKMPQAPAAMPHNGAPRHLRCTLFILLNCALQGLSGEMASLAAWPPWHASYHLWCRIGSWYMA